MSRKTQRYSKEFKAEAVRTVLENQLSISEGASRLSLPEGTLGQWVTAARKGLGTPGSRTVAELESYSAAIFLIPICISFDTAEKRRYATYLILNRRFSFEF
ncbi:transposase [Escherichia coli]|nr:transposase [Escherichia coli]EEU2921672.1 transposase [Escherichia coli]EEW0055181.1 transposase [Escherichia coli]EEW5038363.1 transposase [Escherichia coli]